MNRVEVGKENNNVINKKVIKLNIYDYVLEINDKDIIDVELSYYLVKNLSTTYENGTKVNNSIINNICFELNGYNNDKKKAGISFSINADYDYLKNLPNGLNDITNLFRDGMVKEPNYNWECIDFYSSKNKKEDIYHKVSSLYVYKEEDSFIFKLTIPGKIFTYFKIRR